jgi:hypothetical protein
MQVLAIDPGITTGYVNARISAASPIILVCDQSRMDHKQFWTFLQNIHPDLIVCESFEYRSRARDNLELYSRELIGIANLYNQLNHDTKLIMQTAAQAKGHFSNGQLTSLKVYKKGKEHGRDAMRHFLYWFNFGHGFQYNVAQELHLV